MKVVLKVVVGVFASVSLSLSGTAFAQGYPEQPVRIVVPQGAGGPGDHVARVLAEGLRGVWKDAKIVVENRTGAGGNIGAQHVARAKPDGYTLLSSNIGPLVANHALAKDIGYNSLTDFVPITRLASSPTLLYVRATLPVNSFEELIEFAKKNPGKLNYADGGMGTIPHLGAELLKNLAKIDITRIGYREAGQINAAIGTDQFDIYFTGIEFHRWVENGRMKALAISAPTRHPDAPDVPTMKEVGLPGFTLSAWYALLAPAKTPKDILTKLHTLAQQALQKPEAAKQLQTVGMQVALSTPQELGQQIATERAQWTEIIKSTGMTAK